MTQTTILPARKPPVLTAPSRLVSVIYGSSVSAKIAPLPVLLLMGVRGNCWHCLLMETHMEKLKQFKYILKNGTLKNNNIQYIHKKNNSSDKADENGTRRYIDIVKENRF